MGTEDKDAELRSEIARLRAELTALRADARTDTEVEALRRRVALLEEAQCLAQLGCWRYDPDTLEVEWSREFRAIADLPQDMPANVEEFLARIVEDEREAFTQRCGEILTLREGGKVEGRLQRTNGEVRYIRLQGAVLPNAQGRDELRGTILDVTEHVRLREELAQVQRTEAIGRLAAGVAHDFNNLLTIAIGNVELLADSIGKNQELEECMMALESAANLTRRLLAFGRRAHLTLTVVDLNELVRSTMKLMRRLVGDQLTLETTLEDAVLPVRVDKLELERALVNLVINARDVTPVGGCVRIETARRSEPSGDVVDIKVTDHGPGIPRSELPHIFEPFFTTKQGSGGTGMGLATVLGTAEQHGGSVQIDTELGRGSTFTLTLPEQSLERIVPRSPPSEHPVSRANRSFRILVIDDEPMVAETCRRLLNARGHWVYVVTSPKEALDMWSEHYEQFDMVICDVSMPEMRGPELMGRFAKCGDKPRVLFISGYNEDKSVATSGHPILYKPFTSVTLLDAVARVMNGTG